MTAATFSVADVTTERVAAVSQTTIPKGFPCTPESGLTIEVGSNRARLGQQR
jgi:hypothetical protein